MLNSLKSNDLFMHLDFNHTCRLTLKEDETLLPKNSHPKKIKQSVTQSKYSYYKTIYLVNYNRFRATKQTFIEKMLHLLSEKIQYLMKTRHASQYLMISSLFYLRGFYCRFSLLQEMHSFLCFCFALFSDAHFCNY